MIETGSRISWVAVNGPTSGVVEKVNGDNFFVRLDSGKCVEVNKLSCKEYVEEKPRR